jgi:hypothetical protein
MRRLQEVFARMTDQQAKMVWALVSGAVEDGQVGFDDDEDPAKPLRTVMAACDEVAASWAEGK